MQRRDDEVRDVRRGQRRALYRRRRLMGIAVLAALFVCIGSIAGGLSGESDSGAGDSAESRAGEVRSSGVTPAGYRHSPAGERTVERTETSPPEEPTHSAPEKTAPEEARKSSPESLYVLVLGVDRRPDDPQDSTTRSDTMMLVKVTPQTGRIKLLSVPRDLLVEISPGVEDRVNNAYAHGGIQGAKSVMENLTGVSIDRYAIVDFEGFEKVIDALGAVMLEVERPIRVGIEGQRVYIPAGAQELNGLEALAYARYRGTACGDLDRIERQQQLVSALRAQALRWNTITQLPEIVEVINENVETDLGFTQTISLGRTLIGYGADGGMRAAQLRGEPEVLPNGNAVLVPDEEANESVLKRFRSDGLEGDRPGGDSPSGRGASEC